MRQFGRSLPPRVRDGLPGVIILSGDADLTAAGTCVDDGETTPMRRKFIWRVLMVALAAIVLADADAARQDTKNPPSSATNPPSKRMTIEVSGGDNNVAVENASVYLKYVEEKKIFKDKHYALNVKTNREGVAHIPDAPLGKVLIQIVADGWKTYGKYYELTDPGAVIKIHLDRPLKWY